MADSKLRLQIVTALDNAGLKATKEQIDGIEKSIQKTNATGGLGKVEKQLGNMQGPLGKLGPMFDGLGGKVAQFGGTAMAVIGAFKAGWDIGNWLQEHVIAPLFNLKDPIEELKKANKAIQRQNDAFARSMDRQIEESNSAFTQSTKRIEDQVQYVNKLTQAWIKSTRAKNGYINADQDVHIQRLERERFERVMQLQNNGDIEGAEQMNAYYDFLKTVTQEQLATDKAQQDFEIMKDTLGKAKKNRRNIQDKVTSAENNLESKQNLLDLLEENAYFFKKSDYNKRYKQLTAARDEAFLELGRRQQELKLYDMNTATSEQEIKNKAKEIIAMRDRSQLAIDKSAWGYDQWVNEHGNPLNFMFDPQFIKQLAESAQGTYNDMENLEEAVANGIKEGFSELLEVK